MNEDCYHLGVKALIRNSKGEILLLKVNLEKLTNHSHGAYWDIPGGRVQKGDTVEETLKREVEEETGIVEITDFEPFSMVLSNIRIPTGNETSMGLILSAYICHVNDTANITISEEHIEYGWFTPGQASKLLEVKYPKEFCTKINTL